MKEKIIFENKNWYIIVDFQSWSLPLIIGWTKDGYGFGFLCLKISYIWS